MNLNEIKSVIREEVLYELLVREFKKYKNLNEEILSENIIDSIKSKLKSGVKIALIISALISAGYNNIQATNLVDKAIGVENANSNEKFDSVSDFKSTVLKDIKNYQIKLMKGINKFEIGGKMYYVGIGISTNENIAKEKARTSLGATYLGDSQYFRFTKGNQIAIIMLVLSE